MPFFPPVRGGFFISVIRQAGDHSIENEEKAMLKPLVTEQGGNKSIPDSIANYVIGESEGSQRCQSDKGEDRLR
ncbi:hypothetical protein [Kosakonia sacchari]|uniref:hypothetical protein n=1 Tax=Kosakonia sacchari TaxID=1158459 RepID=UPI0015846620|nr:hypothetical protein [Kosakonia sacchari]NUL39596.1 hypothetical protein [Kosakonia sacchari]